MAELLQLNATTFRPVPGGDVRADITLGGKDPEKFVPNLNVGFSFGGGEEYFDNLNRIDKLTTSKSEVKFDGEKVRLIAGSDIDEIYTDAQGRTKWDVVFEKCPESMVLEWRRTCSPGLTAYYQPALTDEEIKEGSYRPPDVEGSYAIYCDKAHNWIRQLDRKREVPRDWKAQLLAGAALGDVNIAAYREYKTGKVEHKYRPFVIDVDGRTEWCTLLIVGNVERVTLPKDFMASAKYPVRLDPTIGYTSAGGTEYAANNYMFVSNYLTEAGGSGTASKVYAYRRYATTLQLGYYSDIASLPASRIDYDEVSISSSTAAWYSVDVGGGISSGTKYSPGMAWTGASSSSMYYDSGSSGDVRYASSTSTLPSSISSISSHTWRVSMYIEYTESGGGSSLPAKINHFRNMGVM